MNIRERKDLKEAEDIIITICQLLNVTYFDLRSNKRLRKISEARMIVTYFLKQIEYMDCQISALLDRDRTTILYLQKQAKNLIQTAPEFREKVAILQTQL